MKISKEIKIASVAILSAIIVYVGIIFLKGLKLFSDEVSYFVEIADVQGMPTASDVRANGLKVGTVKAITFNPNSRRHQCLYDKGNVGKCHDEFEIRS